MIAFEYLYQGICGLARAHVAGTMAGHLGAAVAAGYFVGEDHADLADGVVQGIESELDRVIRGEEAIWFNAKKAGVTPTDLFKPLTSGKPDTASITSIADALQRNVGRIRQSGHNVIFAALALRALHEHADYATSQTVTGIRQLISAFDKAAPGRGYYGKQKGWLTGNQVTLPPDESFPAYQSVAQMVQLTIAELIADADTRKQGFGGLWHLVNHAAAITDLQRFGYKTLAQKALPAHRQHLRLWRTLPDVEQELGPVKKADRDPRDPAYWTGMLKRDQARLTHRIKTLYGFLTLLRFVEDPPTRDQAENAFLYLMA